MEGMIVILANPGVAKILPPFGRQNDGLCGYPLPPFVRRFFVFNKLQADVCTGMLCFQ